MTAPKGQAPSPVALERLRKREESEAAAQVVRAEVEANKVAAQANTSRLRALRLEKEAADKVRAAEAQALKAPKRSRRNRRAIVGSGTPKVRRSTQR